MKKVFFSLAVLCSVALVSCGGNKAENADSAVDSAAIVAEEVVVADSNESGKEVAVAEAVAEVPVEAAADSAKK